jgi:autotransporter passenger strand-loop-strand repeat protein
VSGGHEDVLAGGTAISTTVSGGAYQKVFASGTASGAVINGGAEYVFPGGRAVRTTVIVGAMNDAGTATSTTVSRGQEVVFPNATASVTVVSSGGQQYVHSSGTAISTTLDSGGFEVVSRGGTASNTTVDSGGFEVVSAGGLAVSTTVNISGAIDLAYLPYASGGSATVTTSGLLTVSVGGQTYTQQLAGDYAGEKFVLGQDTGSGTLVTAEAAPCYRSGTRILTERGEVAVEELRIGDLVPTVLGEAAAPIIWIGRREVDCAGHPKPAQVWPVRVAAGAFGPGRPHTELFLSPDHAVFINDVLIPIRHLINGGSIAQVPVERVTYYHLELPRHDVVLAQGLPAESFLDMRDGSNYAHRPGPVRLYTDYSARMWEAFGCARLIVVGPELEAVRRIVNARALDIEWREATALAEDVA